MKDQQEAEKKKVTSQDIQEQLAVQTKHVKEKKTLVLQDLAKVEPAVMDAQQGEKGSFGGGDLDYLRGTNSHVSYQFQGGPR